MSHRTCMLIQSSSPHLIKTQITHELQNRPRISDRLTVSAQSSSAFCLLHSITFAFLAVLFTLNFFRNKNHFAYDIFLRCGQKNGKFRILMASSILSLACLPLNFIHLNAHSALDAFYELFFHCFCDEHEMRTLSSATGII